MNNLRINYIILCVLLCSFALKLNAKEQVCVLKGMITEHPQSKVMEGAAIRLLSVKDSSFIAGAVSDREGKYQMTLKSTGKYLVQVSFLGFKTQIKTVEFTPEKHMSVLNFRMEPQSLEIGETIVKGKTPEVVVKQDTVEYNADSYKVKEGSPVEDLLRKLPGLRISADGTITIEGKAVSEILVDGRSFFGDDQQLTLKNLPSDLIHKVQVIDKKDKTDEATGFESDEKKKVINLTIKSDRKRGLFGNVNAGYGTKNRYIANAMVNSFLGEDKTSVLLNARNLDMDPMLGSGRYSMGEPTFQNVGVNLNKEFKKGINLDGSIRFKHATDKSINESFTENLLPDSSYFTRNDTDNRTMSRNIGANLKFEYKKDSTMSFEVRPTFQYTYGVSDDISEYETLDGLKKIVNSSSGVNRGKDNRWNYGLEAFLSRRLGKNGRMVTLQTGWTENKADGLSKRLSVNSFTKPTGDSIVNLDQERNVLNKSRSLSLRANYVEPIGKNSSLMINYSIHSGDNENGNNTFSRNEAGLYDQLDSLYSRSTKSNRLSQSVGLSFRSKFKNIAFNMGMAVDPSRFEEQTYVGETVLKDQIQHQLNYSPKLSVFWKNKKGNFISFNYFGRSNTPTARQLSPVIEVLSPISEMQGNPDLKSGFRHQLGANWRYNDKNTQLSVMLFSSAQVEQNTITSYSIYNPQDGKRFTSYRNVNGNWSANNTAMVSIPFRNRDFQFSSNTNIGFSQRTGFTNAEENRSKNMMAGQSLSLNYTGDALTVSFELTGDYSGIRNSLQNLDPQNSWEYGSRVDIIYDLPWDISLGTAVVYRGKSGYAEGYNRQVVNWDAEISKEFLKSNQAKISLIVMDILGQTDSSSRTITATSVSDSRWNSIGQYGMLKFTYRFNLMKGNKQNSDPSGEEMYY